MACQTNNKRDPRPPCTDRTCTVRIRRDARAGLVYRLAGDAEMVTLIKALGRVGERNVAEIGRVVTDYFQARDALEAVSRDELVIRYYSSRPAS